VLCQTAIVHSRTVDGATYTFGHEGILYRQSFIMYDRETRTLWVHTTGEAVKGKLKGKVLKFLPSIVTTWKRWKQLHPDTTVLTGRRANGFMGKFNLRDKPKDYGLSLGQGPAPKLYPFEILMAARVVNDAHEGRPVVVLYDEESGTARAYARGDRTFAWKDGHLVDEGGARWDLMRGARADGAKGRLAEIPATPWLIARWKSFHPRAPVYAAR
jgi:hypothetical protein